MINFLTATCTHKSNPTGSSLATIAANIACSPIDPVASAPVQDYPVERLYITRETYTKYVAFAAGDYLVSGSTTYAVKLVGKWTELDGLDTFYHLVLEEQSGS